MENFSRARARVCVCVCVCVCACARACVRAYVSVRADGSDFAHSDAQSVDNETRQRQFTLLRCACAAEDAPPCVPERRHTAAPADFLATFRFTFAV